MSTQGAIVNSGKSRPIATEMVISRRQCRQLPSRFARTFTLQQTSQLISAVTRFCHKQEKRLTEYLLTRFKTLIYRNLHRSYQAFYKNSRALAHILPIAIRIPSNSLGSLFTARRHCSTRSSISYSSFPAYLRSRTKPDIRVHPQ